MKLGIDLYDLVGSFVQYVALSKAEFIAVAEG